MRFIAVDWSGAVKGAAEKIWIAEAADGHLLRLENGRGRDGTTRWLAQQADGGNLVVGLDFAFSAPAWFLRSNGLQSAPQLWDLAGREGERWLRDCVPPFWGRPGTKRPVIEDHFRRTEREVPSVRGVTPKSVFQVGGAGAVGTGSWRGMPFLLRLKTAGFAIWPFDPVSLAVTVEIYPRLLTAAVTKSDSDARRDYLLRRFPNLETDMAQKAASSEDALDAAVSALVMAAEAQRLASLPVARDETDMLEGRIWHPAI